MAYASSAVHLITWAMPADQTVQDLPMLEGAGFQIPIPWKCLM
jgi:hypothetical protein